MTDIEVDNLRSQEKAQLLPPSLPFGTTYSRFFLICMMLAYLSNYLDRTVIMILLEPIRADFNFTDAELGWLGGTAFACFYSTMGLPISCLADRYNRVNILCISVFFWSLMTATQGLCQNFTQLFLCRMGVGLGEAGSSPASHSILTDLFPPAQRGRAMGIYSAGIAIGTIVGSLCGLLAEAVGWRATFFTLGVPGVVMAVFMRLTLREPPRGHKKEESSDTLSDTKQVSGGGTCGFLFRQKSLCFHSLGAGLVSLASYGTANFAGTFWFRRHGLDLGDRSLVLTGLAVANLISTVMGGEIADRWAKTRGFAAYGLTPALCLCISPCLYVIALYSPFVPSIILFAGHSLLNGTWRSCNFGMAQALARPHERAFAAALNLGLQSMIGLGLGPIVVGAVSDALTKTYGPTDGLVLALALAMPFELLSGLSFYLASLWLESDIRRASP